MIQTFSSTIRRKEMDAVLTCMVDERIGPGELNSRFIQQIKVFFDCDGAVALRSPVDALKYALMALDFSKDDYIMISALAPAWHIQAIENLGYKPLVLDIDESTGVVNAEIVQRGINHGGRLLLLHESNGILPEMNSIMDLKIPVVEDVSKSAGALVPSQDDKGNPCKPEKAGSFGVYTILGLEENDVITAGGGAVLMAPGRKEWIVLKKYIDSISKVELLPDINCALGWIQLKEFIRNEISRKEIFSLYQRACMSGRHKMFTRNNNSGEIPLEFCNVPAKCTETKNDENGNAQQEKSVSLDFTSTMSSFPVVLSSSYKDVKQYVSKKEIEISLAYEDSVIALREEELSESCIKAKSLYLRTALFPIYPRLSKSQVAKIVKVLSTLP